ncbi:hypothetical protein Pint_15357 [Pistacia integerrima]|uniref:Uncharacterized protein n=1 Tax=Pistacia integerrima TaxID=434235 RepID=A0ACC0ZBZ6_9ROSI|nr:hypothetical protein Pint_15357 [Pistacia integerrima]
MASSKFGLREELINKACSLAMKAYKYPEKLYLHDKSSKTDVIFSFAGTWSVNEWFSKNPFGKKEINRDQFPSLRSISNDEVATVNEAFLNRFLTISPHILKEVGKAVAENKQIVFTGHSSGGAIAILVTVWFLQQQYKPDSTINLRKLPFCVTFGSPLVGDRIFNHALGRENWSQYFLHFVSRYDIIPRVLFAPLSSIERYLPLILDYLNPKTTLPVQEPIEEASKLYENVMRNASSLTSHAASQLMGNTNRLSETLSSFIELSPYRPFGNYIIFTDDESELLLVKNPDAILQILFYSFQLRSEAEVQQVAIRSLKEHQKYLDKLQSLETKNVTDLDSWDGLPLSSDGVVGRERIDTLLNNLGLSTRARLCLCAAKELEKQKLRNQERIDGKMRNIENGIEKLERYKAKCEANKHSYYDAFKKSKGHDDFAANVTRLELVGIIDEIMEMIKRYELPDGFEGREEWLNIGTRYRRIVEPLDIANYYRHLKNEDTGAYMIKGRPKRYRFTQKWREYAFKMEKGSSWESCFWAEVEELEICLRTSNNFGLSEDVRERISHLDEKVESWIHRGELGADVFFEGSTFIKWWNTLPEQLRSESRISGLINKTFCP